MSREDAVRVIAVGERARGDDGVGPAVADALEARGHAVRRLWGEPAEVLEALSGAAAVVLVDAVRSGAAPGAVSVLDLAGVRLRETAGLRTSSHGLGLGEAVELARALGELPARAALVGVEGARFEPGAGLSPAAAAAIPEAVRVVESILERWRLGGEARDA